MMAGSCSIICAVAIVISMRRNQYEQGADTGANYFANVGRDHRAQGAQGRSIDDVMYYVISKTQHVFAVTPRDQK